MQSTSTRPQRAIVLDSCYSSAASNSSFTSMVAGMQRTRKPCIAAATPSAITGWDLPVPESPISELTVGRTARQLACWQWRFGPKHD